MDKMIPPFFMTMYAIKKLYSEPEIQSQFYSYLYSVCF